MSRCDCDSRHDLRLTAEYLEHRGEARLRCNKCSGKVGYIPVNKLCGLVDEPEEGEPVTVTLHIGDNPMEMMD